MKHFPFSKAFMALSMGAMLTGCALDDNGLTGGETTVTFTAQLPYAMPTRAGELAGSGNQATKVHVLVYPQGSNVAVIDKYQEITDGSKKINVPLTLANGQTYDVVFWADAFGESANSPYSITDGKLTVTYANMTPNDDVDDAFYGKTSFKAAPGQNTQTVNLFRPFAKLNLGTDDMGVPAVEKHYGTTKLFTSVEATVYTDFDLVSGTVDPTKSTTHTFTDDARKITFEYPVGTTHKYTNMAYVLVGNDTPLSKVTFKSYTGITADALTPVHTVEVKDVPLKPNFRTNIYGSLLTSTTNFKVEIDSEFGGVNNYPVQVSNVAEMQAAVEQGANVLVLTGNMDANETLTVNNKAITIDAGSYTLPAIAAQDGAVINVYGTKAAPAAARRRTAASTTTANEDPRFWAKGTAVINIYGGSYVATTDQNGDSNACVYASAGGTVNIYGGEFSVQKPYNGKYFVLNLSDSTPGVINVYGGSFKNQDIQHSNTEPAPHNFVAADAQVAVVQDGEWYRVVSLVWDGVSRVQPAREGNVFTISTPAQLAWYADYSKTNVTSGNVVNITNDLDLANHPWPMIGTMDNGFKGHFNGNGHVIKNLNISGNQAVTSVGFIVKSDWEEIARISNLTFENVKLSATGMGGFYVGVVLGCGQATIENVTVKNAVVKGTERVGGIAGQLYGTARNCTLDGATIDVEYVQTVSAWDGANTGGGIVAFLPNGEVLNSTVKNTTITAYRKCGAIVGSAANERECTISGNTATDVTLVYNGSNAYKGDQTSTFGEIVGQTYDLTVTMENNTATRVTIK